jgi:hypothetical protein
MRGNTISSRQFLSFVLTKWFSSQTLQIVMITLSSPCFCSSISQQSKFKLVFFFYFYLLFFDTMSELETKHKTDKWCYFISWGCIESSHQEPYVFLKIPFQLCAKKEFRSWQSRLDNRKLATKDN